MDDAMGSPKDKAMASSMDDAKTSSMEQLSMASVLGWLQTMGRLVVCAMVFVVGLPHCVVTCLNDLRNRGSLRSRNFTESEK